MADYSQSKPIIGKPLPDNAVDAAWSRYGPLITAQQLKDMFLFGVSLKDPATRQEMSLDIIDQHIEEAVTDCEEEVGIQIFPTQHKERQEFDHHKYMMMGYMRVRQRPVQSIESLAVVTANGQTIWQVSLDWIDVGYLDQGYLYIIPINVALAPTASSGGGAGGAAFLAILGQQPYVPGYWNIQYTTGFADGKIPRNVNQLIGCQAAINILNQLAQANAKSGSKSMSIDSLSQSNSNPGPDIYKTAIAELKERKKKYVKRLKAHFGLSFIASEV